MKNDYGLSPTDVRLIDSLTPEQLAAVRRNIKSPDYTDDETREALAQYCADGGEIEDML